MDFILSSLSTFNETTRHDKAQYNTTQYGTVTCNKDDEEADDSDDGEGGHDDDDDARNDERSSVESIDNGNSQAAQQQQQQQQAGDGGRSQRALERAQRARGRLQQHSESEGEQ